MFMAQQRLESFHWEKNDKIDLACKAHPALARM